MTPSSSPNRGNKASMNLYETWVRNPLISRLIESPSLSDSAMRSMRLVPHILEPMVSSAWITSCESFTIEEICQAQTNYFATLQSIFPSTQASLLVHGFKLILTLPTVLLKALFSRSALRPFIWSSWWWSAKLPLFVPSLPAEAQQVNFEDCVDPKVSSIQPLFRGSHQLVELVCFFGTRLVRSATKLMEAGERDYATAEMIDGAKLLHCMSQFLNILAQLDTRKYQEYRPSLKGTSGGDSINLRLLTRMCRAFQVDGDDLSKPTDNGLLNAVHSLQYGIGLFWAAHLALAVTSNGLDSTGTAGTSIRQMFVHLEGILNTKFSQWVPRYAAACPPNSRWIDMCGTEKEIGEAIFNEGRYVEVPQPPAPALVDQPEKLFEDDWRAYFASQSMCPPLKPGIVELQDLQKDHLGRLDLGYFYGCVLPAFEETVLKLLQLEGSKAAVSMGGNLSEHMLRILVALQKVSKKGSVVVSGSADFLSFRAAWRMLQRDGWVREEALTSDSLDLALPVIAAIKKHGRKVRLVHVTAVSSVYQYAFTQHELVAIVDAANSVGAVVLIDVCQSFCNIEYDFDKITKGSKDVFILGSCVKHARSLEGVGWCAFNPESSLRENLPSGWCADLSMLNYPMHDPDFKEMRTRLDGGTVANAVHAEFFVEQQQYLLQNGLSTRVVNDRVWRLQNLFMSQLGVDADGQADFCRVEGWCRRQAYPEARSKVLVLDCHAGPVAAGDLTSQLRDLGFRVDSRHDRFLRIGFDLCHTEANVIGLADAISSLVQRED